MSLKQRLGNKLIRLGLRWAPQPDVSKTVIKQALQEPTSGVVEAPIEAEQWKPVQHGNVIIVEPDVMKQFKRDHL